MISHQQLGLHQSSSVMLNLNTCARIHIANSQYTLHTTQTKANVSHSTPSIFEAKQAINQSLSLSILVNNGVSHR